jgi:hypothetical protein
MQFKSGKIECINPNTDHKMNIDKDIYDLFSRAIYHTLKTNTQGISFSELVKGVKKWFKEQNASFKGSVDWYTITVKYDMEAKGLIEVSVAKGKKLNRLTSNP